MQPFLCFCFWSQREPFWPPLFLFIWEVFKTQQATFTWKQFFKSFPCLFSFLTIFHVLFVRESVNFLKSRPDSVLSVSGDSATISSLWVNFLSTILTLAFASRISWASFVQFLSFSWAPSGLLKLHFARSAFISVDVAWLVQLVTAWSFHVYWAQQTVLTLSLGLKLHSYCCWSSFCF